MREVGLRLSRTVPLGTGARDIVLWGNTKRSVGNHQSDCFKKGMESSSDNATIQVPEPHALAFNLLTCRSIAKSVWLDIGGNRNLYLSSEPSLKSVGSTRAATCI